MARSSLRKQFKDAVVKCGRFGKPKHEDKTGTQDGGSGYLPKVPWVYSDNHKEGLLSFSRQMANYIKTIHPEIKYVGKIKARHWNAFLKEKDTECSTTTFITYGSYVGKLERCLEKHYSFKYPLNWIKGLVVPDSQKTPGREKLRVQQMSRNDFNMIMDHFHRGGARGSRGKIALEICSRFGLRVEECADICKKNLHLNKRGGFGHGYIDIVGKGKRYRQIDVRTHEDREYLLEISAGLSMDDKLVGIKKDSINACLRRACQALNIKKKYPETGLHSIRKMYAQEAYLWLQTEKKLTEEEAIRYLNLQLGHSADRDINLLAIYVKDVDRKIKRERERKRNNRSGR